MTAAELLHGKAKSGLRHKLSAGVLSALASGMVFGQQVGNPATLAPLEEVAVTPSYTVELIVFGYNDSSAADTELFAPDVLPGKDPATAFPLPELADDERAGVMMPPAVAVQDEDAEDDSPPPFTAEELILNEVQTYGQAGLKILDPSAYVLNDIYDKLVKLDAYTPLVHTAWTQEPVAKELAKPINLRRLGDSPLRLNGTITLYLSRYLHLVIDLALDEKNNGSVAYESTPYYGDNSKRSDYAFGFDQEYRSAPIHYRIAEDRIVRNDELRYYDHPKFGVLAKITRVEIPEQQIGTMATPQDGFGK